MGYKFVRTHSDKHGKAVTVVYDVPEFDVMTKDEEAFIHSSTGASHVSLHPGIEDMPRRRSEDTFANGKDYVV